VSPAGHNPWESLDQGATHGGDRPLYPEAGTLRTLWRGLRKRCPRCGTRGLFTSWFVLKADCPRCELRFEKEEGGFLGAMTLNFIAAILLWLIVMAVGLVLTVPDVPVPPLLAASVVVLVLVPLWFYPRSKTIWAAVEFLVLKSDPDYRAPVRRDPRAHDLE
jgi:uncharacterized protein (DUF983 family)